jgi:hypothetical protein
MIREIETRRRGTVVGFDIRIGRRDIRRSEVCFDHSRLKKPAVTIMISQKVATFEGLTGRSLHARQNLIL